MMKKFIILTLVISLSGIMAWAFYWNTSTKPIRIKSANSESFVLSDTQKICIKELLKIQAFYKKHPKFNAKLLKNISPEGGKGEEVLVDVLADGTNFLMSGEIALVSNNNKFFAQIDHENKQVLISYPNNQNPLGFKFKDYKSAFKDSLISVEFKRQGEIATLTYSNYIENTVTYLSYHYTTGELMRMTETYYDSWDGESDEVKITEDCIVKSFEPIIKPIEASKFQLNNYLVEKDSVFTGVGKYSTYEIIDTRYKN